MRPMTIFAKPGKGFAATVAALALPLSLLAIDQAHASTPSETAITAPADSGSKVTVTKTFSGSTPLTGSLDPLLCTPANCDTHTLHLSLPKGYWGGHTGDVKVTIDWADETSDLDLYVLDSDGNQVGASATSSSPEVADLGMLAPGDYTIQVMSFVAQPALSFTGTITMTSQKLTGGMVLPENKNTLMDELTVHYPLRVVFVGRKPSAAEIAELKANIPTQYQPTVANVAGSTSPTGDAVPDPAGATGLINWNKVHYGPGQNPYFLGLRYKYDLQVLVATDAYTKALFNVAEQHTAHNVAFRDDAMTAQLAKYDESYGQFRLAAKGGDPSYKVTDPTTHDLVDGVAVEDWMFKTRTSPAWKCAFKDATTHACVSAKVLQNTANSYHDPYYDKFGLNLDKMPQGVNKGSSYLFFDTFTPSFAKDYFRPGAYHVWGTDKVIDGKIVEKPATAGGSWRITDPDTNEWAGVDFARTWGGRYRWHFFDLGAAPNNYEDITWANYGALESSDYPQGDPPVWQYDADPLWQQSSGECQVTSETAYTGDTPCRIMPRLARDVAYGLFFRSTPGYLYRPIPQGDVYWLATTNFTDFYSRPQWVDGSPAPVGSPYGTWWTDLTKLFQIDSVTKKTHDDTLRWLSSAMPYVKWVGRKGQVIPLYDPKTGKKTGTLDTSPKYADLPAPEYHVTQSGAGVEMLPEPLYGGKHVIKKNADSSTIDLTQFQNEIEKAKASGLTGATYDDSVNTDIVRDYIDAHRTGMADRVPGLGTVPSLNMVFEKAYTWALPAIVGGIALADKNGNAWGVFNNVNDRFKACESNYPVYDPTVNQAGDKVSLLPCHPKQQPGTGFSYTIEHEAAHNLGLSHPHDGSYGVDKCPEGDPNAGKWMCYWQGLGWVMDVSAAPTTYAMAYRPYEVEDQDNLQRGHIAEYFLGAQASLQKQLLLESKAGRTTPSAVFKARYSRYKALKAVAVKLFRAGDYLHAEYAARDAALAAKGVRQTSANTIDPRLVQAGQVFYFRVHPQSTRGITY